MSLTDTKIKKSTALEKDYQLADGDGLSLIIRKMGTKAWRYEFRLNGKKQKYLYGVSKVEHIRTKAFKKTTSDPECRCAEYERRYRLPDKPTTCRPVATS